VEVLVERITDRVRTTPAWTAAVAVARLDRALRVVEASLHLGTADMRLLWLLADGQERTMKEISQLLLLEASTVNRQVNAAIAAGILERGEPESGARPVRPTEFGTQRFNSDLTRAMTTMAAGLAALPEDEVPGFLANLTLFVDAYRQAAEVLVDSPAQP
jgi:predicted transcriptional regulator